MNPTNGPVEVALGAGRVHRLISPVLDRVLATVGLVLASPLLLAIAIAIRLESPGPAIFRQRRVGHEGAEFTLYKFRTMRAGVSDAPHRTYVRSLLGEPDDGEASAGSGPAPDGVFKLANDDRITRVGRLLRRTSLDELPQLVNVLKGEMALVGPRPALDYEVDLYREEDFVRFAVHPGITGLWQTTARNTVDMRAMLEIDRQYVAQQSLALDLRILARTVVEVLHPSGAR